MVNPRSLRLNFRRAAAFGALAIGVVAFSGAAAAAPLPLFPFVMERPVQSPPPALQIGAITKIKAPASNCRHG